MISGYIVRVYLKCDEDRLYGFDNGKDCYLSQVDSVWDYDCLVNIVFPVNVENVSLMFIDGFLSEVFKHIDVSDFTKYVAINGNAKVVNKFYKYCFIM